MTATSKQNRDKYNVNISTWVDKKTSEELHEMAHDRNVSISHIIRQAVEVALSNYQDNKYGEYINERNQKANQIP